MCGCLTASQAVLERIAGQFGMLAALFFLLGLICAFGYKYGAVLFEPTFQGTYPDLSATRGAILDSMCMDMSMIDGLSIFNTPI